MHTTDVFYNGFCSERAFYMQYTHLSTTKLLSIEIQKQMYPCQSSIQLQLHLFVFSKAGNKVETPQFRIQHMLGREHLQVGDSY